MVCSLRASGDVPNLRPDSVGAVDQAPAFGNLVDRVDEDNAAAAEALDDVIVVHNLVVDVERRTEQLQSTIERADRHDDAGTKAMGIGQNDSHRCFLEYRLARGETTDRRVEALAAWRSGPGRHHR